MSVQTTYTKVMRQAIPGQVAYDFGTADIASFNALETIEFGVAVQRGAPNQAKNSVRLGGTVALTAATTLGFATRSLLQQRADTLGLTSYAVTETAAVMRKGYVYVVNTGSTAIAAGSPVRINNVTGAVTGDAVGGAVIALPNVSAEEDAAAGAVLLIRINK